MIDRLIGRQFRRTTVISVFLASFLIGLYFSRSLDSYPLSTVVFCLFLFIAVVKQKRLAAIVAAALLGYVLGVARGATVNTELSLFERLYAQEVIIQGSVTTDGAYTDGGQLQFDIGSLKFIEPFAEDIRGTVRIEAFGLPAIYRGDVIEAKGKIYPAGGARQGQIKFAEVAVIGRPNNPVENTRQEFAAGLQSALPEPHASLGLGLLIGQRSNLPDGLLESLSIVGLTHIIAVSGYNLTIIVRVMRRLLAKVSRYQTVLFASVFILVFMLVTGFSASVVRASIVSGLSLVAWYYGYMFKPVVILLLSGAITAGWNPIYIWSDLGWHLSFLAFFGVLIMAPLISQRLYGKDHKPKLVGQVVLESLSAQIMTAPLIMLIFNQFSVISLLSNLIIVPLVPLAMLASLMGGIVGMIAPAIAGWFALPAQIILTFMVDMVYLLARLPSALKQITLTGSQAIFMYGVLLIILIVMAHRVKRLHGTITDTNILE